MDIVNGESGATRCPYCQLRYEDFRTGFKYVDIYEMFWSTSEDPTTWRHKRRHTILGRWHQIKLEMWDEHIQLCEENAEFIEKGKVNDENSIDTDNGVRSILRDSSF